MHSTGHFTGADQLNLYYQCWNSGKSGNSVLVFIHGMAEHSDRYLFPVNYFSRKGYTVYVMDLRGHGNSEGRRAYADSMSQLLEDIHCFLKMIREKEPGKKIILVGHSFGGQLVLNYGASHRNGVAGLIVSSPNIRLKLKVPFIKLLAAPILSRALPTLSLGNELDASLISHDREVVEAYRKDPKVLHKITARLADIVLENHLKIMEYAKKIKVPSLMMHAGDDQICDPEGTREFFDKIPGRDKSLKIYNGYYHELFNEVERDKVFRDMEAWIEKRN